MTEKEALRKRCPSDLSSKCLGTLCMAWRWDDVPNPEYSHFMQWSPAVPSTIKSTTDGHCGLAHG